MVNKFNGKKIRYCNRVESKMLLHISRCVAAIRIVTEVNCFLLFVFAGYFDDPKKV